MRIVYMKFIELLSELLDSLKKLIFASRADKLLIAAFVVATLRQMGVNGHFIGYDPASVWSWFQPLEVISGVAMAVLEGLALAYVSRRWRKLKPESYTEWTYWSILLIGQIVMLISVIVYVALYAYAAQRALTVAEVFTPGINMVWNFTVAGVNPLIAILIGIVDDSTLDAVQEETEVISDEEEAWLVITRQLRRYDKKLTPMELAELANIPISTAAKVLSEALRLNIYREEEKS